LKTLSVVGIGEVGSVAHKLPSDLDGIESIRIARDVHGAAADLASDRSIALSMDGEPPEGEDDIRRVAEILRQKLVEAGEAWHETRLCPEGTDADCEFWGPSGPGPLIQVTRGERQLWKELAQVGKVARHLVPGEAADGLKFAVEKKGGHYPIVQRRRLVLALDVALAPHLALNAVASAYRDRYADWTRRLGFHAVWLIGPTTASTYRLD
jgi:hypothetical protein